MKDTAKKIKKMVKAKDYDNAIIEIDNYEKMLKDIRNEIKNIDANSVGSMTFGVLVGDLPFIGRTLIATALSIPTFGISSMVVEIQKLVSRIKTLMKNIEEDDFHFDDLNFYKNGILARIDEFIDICDSQKKIIEKNKNK